MWIELNGLKDVFSRKLSQKYDAVHAPCDVQMESFYNIMEEIFASHCYMTQIPIKIYIASQAGILN